MSPPLPWLSPKHLALGLFFLACEPTRQPLEEVLPEDAALPSYLDARPLRDGTVVAPDGHPLAGDAARFTEAGLCETGSASGVACTPSGQPLAQVEVVAATRDCAGEPALVRTVSGAGGRFQLSGLSPGLAEVTLSAGSFISRFSVEIRAGVDVSVGGGSSKTCLDASSTKIAVLSGRYDQIQALLTDLGFEYDLFCGERGNAQSGLSLLQDRARLLTYDLLFINCGSGIDLAATNPEVQAVVEHLRAFVEAGGSLYVSDLAADFISRPFPERLGLAFNSPAPYEAPACCVCGDCPPECLEEARPPLTCEGCCEEPIRRPTSCGVGSPVMGNGRVGEVPARIRSPLLAAWLAEDTVTVAFDLSGWVAITSVGEGVEVLVESLSGVPLMALFEGAPGGGRVVYTSFHNHAQAPEPMRALLRALVFLL